MQPERSTDAPKLELPKELLAATQRSGITRRGDFSVESFKPSFFERFIEKLTGRK